MRIALKNSKDEMIGELNFSTNFGAMIKDITKRLAHGEEIKIEGDIQELKELSNFLAVLSFKKLF